MGGEETKAWQKGFFIDPEGTAFRLKAEAGDKMIKPKEKPPKRKNRDNKIVSDFLNQERNAVIYGEGKRPDFNLLTPSQRRQYFARKKAQERAAEKWRRGLNIEEKGVDVPGTTITGLKFGQDQWRPHPLENPDYENLQRMARTVKEIIGSK